MGGKFLEAAAGTIRALDRFCGGRGLRRASKTSECESDARGLSHDGLR